ncbi:MAG: hypothetical protein GY722_28015 [bacterium]|nr:hypothetical protein [bacterium]
MGDTDENRRIERWTRRDQALDTGMMLAAGFAAAATLGLLIGILTSADVLPAIGFATLALGVLCLLSAGLTGGQYAAGGVGVGAARHMFVKESFAFGPDRNRSSGSDSSPLLEELSHGYRAKKDPIALWLSIGGILYLAVGLAIVMAGS